MRDRAPAHGEMECEPVQLVPTTMDKGVATMDQSAPMPPAAMMAVKGTARAVGAMTAAGMAMAAAVIAKSVSTSSRMVKPPGTLAVTISFCVTVGSEALSNSPATGHRAIKPTSIRDLVMNGWATMLGTTEPNSRVALDCAEKVAA